MNKTKDTCCHCTDKNSGAKKKSDQKPKGKKISPLLLVAGSLAIGAACLNSWVGSPNYSFGLEENYKSITAADGALAGARLQLSITKESILRPGGDALYYAMINMALLRKHQHRDSEAIHWLKKAAAFRQYNLSPTDPWLYNLGELYLRNGRVEDAYQLMHWWEQRSLMDKNTLSNELIPFYLLKAKVSILAKKPEEVKEAERLAEKCMSLPRHAYIHEGEPSKGSDNIQSSLFYWGCTQMAQGNLAGARRIMQMLIKGLPDVPAENDVRDDAIYMTAVIDSLAGNLAQAEKSFAEASLVPVDAASNDSNARTAFCHHYVRFLRAKGRNSEAAKYEAEELKARKHEFGAIWTN